MIGLHSRVTVAGRPGRVTALGTGAMRGQFCVTGEDGYAGWYPADLLKEIGEPLPRRVPPKEPVVCASPLAIKATYQWNMSSKARGRI